MKVASHSALPFTGLSTKTMQLHLEGVQREYLPHAIKLLCHVSIACLYCRFDDDDVLINNG